MLFDEFHERSLDADFGLALALESQGALRPDLRLLVMSATLDDQRLSALLGDAPVIRSEGRTYPIETRYTGRDATKRIEEQVAERHLSALRSERGSILAFLPGQGEIERVARLLEEAKLPADADLCPLYGALDFAKQDAAIRPSPAGRRKIVLATSIAETSLTIEGVRIVVDSGLARVPRYEPDLGLSRLETVRVSRASADQRRGRAGAPSPGIAIRLWDEAQDQGCCPSTARKFWKPIFPASGWIARARASAIPPASRCSIRRRKPLCVRQPTSSRNSARWMRRAA